MLNRVLAFGWVLGKLLGDISKRLLAVLRLFSNAFPEFSGQACPITTASGDAWTLTSRQVAV